MLRSISPFQTLSYLPRLVKDSGGKASCSFLPVFRRWQISRFLSSTSAPDAPLNEKIKCDSLDTSVRTSSDSAAANVNDSDDVKEKVKASVGRGFLTESEETYSPYQYVYPEFLPDPDMSRRNKVREKLERMDMIKRRGNVDIPEFYVGSILSVVTSDPVAPGKSRHFVGICTERGGTGLSAFFVLRNVVDGEGIEICYDMYNPTIQSITVLKLEKRLDENLRYLRDAPQEYSMFSFDMTPETRAPDSPVPINPLKVKLKPKPWSAKWQLWDLKGIEDISDQLEKWELKKFETWKLRTNYELKEMDLMKTYRETIPASDQVDIYSEVHQQLTKLNSSLKKQKKKRTFQKPSKTA